VTHIAHLRDYKLFSYTGDYDNFERQLREQQRLSMAMRDKQEVERRHLESFVNRFKAKASKAKQAQSRVKRLEKMKPVATIINDPIPPIDLPSPEKALSPPIVRFDEVTLGYVEGEAVLRNLELRIDTDDRIGILGRNGEGKSTFAKAVMGDLEPQSGYVRRHKKLKIGYFAQHEIDELNLNESPYDHVRDLMPDATEAQRRARLARFGLGVKNAETPARDLSGGEKARLLFSLISFHAPHLLVLDEPTNHLDMDSRAELIKALNDYEGAVLIISHDRNILESVVDELWVVEDGGIDRYDGTLIDYRKSQLEKLRTAGKSKVKKESKADIRRAAAQAREAIAPLKQKVRQIEKRMEQLRGKVVKFDKELETPGLFEDTPEKAAQIGKKRGKVLSELDGLEEQWLEASDAYEQAKTA